MGLPAENQEQKDYTALPTIEKFHESMAPIRCIVGPVGSGKTSGVAMEVGYYIPWFLYQEYGIKKSRGVVVRNTYRELMDTTCKTIMDPSEGWFSAGEYKAGPNEFTIRYPNGIETELLFRSCDRIQDVKKFKSLEITWYWVDESIEVADDIKRMLKNRIGRYPSWSTWVKALKNKYAGLKDMTAEQIHEIVDAEPERFITRFGIETSNPPDVEHTTYWEFDWGDTPPPGPPPSKSPKKNHRGFWQPPYENIKNLRPGYYEDLKNDYSDSPDWAERYVEGKPGIIVQGKLVYANFRRDLHVAKEPLIWSKSHLYRGWDNTGNTPACIVAQMPTARHIQVLKEFTTDRLGIVDFTEIVAAQCNTLFPGAEYTEWADPAGENEFSKKGGGFTSNAKLMAESAAKIKVLPSDQNLTARIQAVDQALGRIDGILIDLSCIRLINGFMGGYCYKEVEPGRFKDTPEKNRFSHIHDALQYLLIKLLQGSSGKDTTGWRPKRK